QMTAVFILFAIAFASFFNPIQCLRRDRADQPKGIDVSGHQGNVDWSKSWSPLQ
ncbi:unnamed protein product, partial [Rotaria sordida]